MAFEGDAFMGTNYYCETGRMLEMECDCGFRHLMPETLHIGKSSCGWKFMLHAIPEKGLEGWRDWEEVLVDARRIFDEYGDDVTLEEMREKVLHRARNPDDREKAWMEETAERYGYLLDRRTWLFGGGAGRMQGEDGDYSMMQGEFS